MAVLAIAVRLLPVYNPYGMVFSPLPFKGLAFVRENSLQSLAVHLAVKTLGFLQLHATALIQQIVYRLVGDFIAQGQ